MQYRIDARSFVESNAGAIYIEGLATAPRNRPWLVARPQYRGVGDGLLLRAVMHSYTLGLGGRVNLISFDDQRSVAFYEHRRMVVVGHDEELPMLEMAPEVAQVWLQEVGYEIEK